MCLQQWLVFSECIPKMEMAFPIRLAKNCSAEWEPLWRGEHLQLFGTRASVRGVLRSVWSWVQVGTGCGWGAWYQYWKNTAAVTRIRRDFWAVWANLFVKPLSRSSDVIKKDYPSYNKETQSSSYYDFNPVTCLITFNHKYQSEKDEWCSLKEI